MRSCLFALLVVAGQFFYAASADAAPPQWIWSTPDAATKAAPGSVYFRKWFEAPEPESGELEISADNSYELFINGRNVGAGEGWQQRTKYQIGPYLAPGRNLIAVHARNAGADPAGLMVKATVKSKGGKPTVEVVSDNSWKFATKVGGRWAVTDFDDGSWQKAHALGEYGKSGPWGGPGQLVEAQTSIIPVGAKSTEKGHFALRDGDRVVLLGGTFIERLQSDGYLETTLAGALPSKNISYRNVGWSGDTVWGDSRGVFGGRADGFKRLVNDVALCKPTVIVVCYGQNEAYAGQDGLADFEHGLNDLLNALEPTGARIVLLTPPPREEVGPAAAFASKYNSDLAEYCKSIRGIAADRGHTFADFFAAVQERLKNAPANQPPLTDNGQHLTPYGNWVTAKDFAKVLGVPRDAWTVNIDVAKNTLAARGTAVSDLKHDANGLSFVATDRFLPTPDLARADYPSADFVPTASQTLEVAGLAPGKYQLLIDGQLAGEVELTGEPKAITFDNAAARERLTKLRQLIGEKNELFFHRHRPQNETYLFLFRKHEQGNNAVEIPMFDPLVEEKEKQIAELRQPLKQKYELRRVSK